MNLAILSKQFLIEHPPKPEFFQPLMGLPYWSDRMVPVYGWRDTIYVACSRVPAKTPEIPGKAVVLLLCEELSLRDAWTELKKAPPLPVSAPVDSMPGIPTLSVTDSASNIPVIEEIAQEPLSSLQPPSTLSVPSELELSHDPFASLSTDSAPPAVADNTDLLNDLAPSLSGGSASAPSEELVLSDSEPESELAGENEPKEESSDSENLVLEPMGEAPVVNLVRLAPAEIAARMPAPPTAPAADPKAAAAPAVPAVPAVPESAPPAPAAKAAPSATPLSTAKIVEQAMESKVRTNTVTKATPAAQGLSFEAAHTDLKKTYKKIMLLSFENGVFKPIKWSEEFQAPQQVESVETETASPFKVVRKTLKPFHGPVSDNDVTKHFFEQWLPNEAVETLTISPLLIEDQMIGALLSIGDSQAYNKLALRHVDKWAEVFAKEIKNQPSLLQAS